MANKILTDGGYMVNRAVNAVKGGIDAVKKNYKYYKAGKKVAADAEELKAKEAGNAQAIKSGLLNPAKQKMIDEKVKRGEGI